jgi:RNA polymerase-associated protein CTR9
LVEADALLKEANASNANDLYLRNYVGTHLFRQGMWDDLAKFAQATRKLTADDAHTWCVLGAYHYHQARESRAPHAERLKEFCRSAEAYNQALNADPSCAVAAQGLAIAIAEDSLATKASEVLGGEEMAKSTRIRNAESALAIFSRVKDSLSDASVLVNSGHCYFVKGDEERAIEAVS